MTTPVYSQDLVAALAEGYALVERARESLMFPMLMERGRAAATGTALPAAHPFARLEAELTAVSEMVLDIANHLDVEIDPEEQDRRIMGPILDVEEIAEGEAEIECEPGASVDEIHRHLGAVLGLDPDRCPLLVPLQRTPDADTYRVLTT